jgi:CheY-like chemotaxis protein
LQAANVDLDEQHAAALGGRRPGRYVRLRVTDTGAGIADAVRPHIFESFFTTKPDGEGTGLGLSTVDAIVRDHGGFVTFTTARGSGTTFEVHLPASPVSPTPVADAHGREALPAGNGELVLVVDDEPRWCDAARRALERQGYRAVVASDGADALGVFAAHRDAIRAVITDWMMPRMDGVDLCRSLRRLASDLPVIVSSGGLHGRVGDEATRALEDLGVAGILQRPHSIDALLSTLARALGQREAPPTAE